MWFIKCSGRRRQSASFRWMCCTVWIRVMIYFCEHRVLHDKAWLVKVGKMLDLFWWYNILMVCPNSVATRRSPSVQAAHRPPLCVYLPHLHFTQSSSVTRSHVPLTCSPIAWRGLLSSACLQNCTRTKKRGQNGHVDSCIFNVFLAISRKVSRKIHLDPTTV